MRTRNLNSWELTPKEAVALQRQLAGLVSARPLRVEPKLVAGVDMSPPGPDGCCRAAVVILDYPGLAVVEVQSAALKPPFPYIPGLLSFREAPAVLAACEKVASEPDLVIVDGHGYSHPRRMGIASHIGLLLDRPTIGCAKSVLVGKFTDPDSERGGRADLLDDGEVIGAAVRTRAGVKPVFVSVGHKIDLDGAVQWVLNCCRGYRLPEPTRLAHRAAAGNLPAGAVQPPPHQSRSGLKPAVA